VHPAANCFAVLDRCGTRRTIGRMFREPVADDSLEQLKYSRFPRNTVNMSTWVVTLTLFGEWRAQRNRRCLENPNGSLVYLINCVVDNVQLFISRCVWCFSGVVDCAGQTVRRAVQ